MKIKSGIFLLILFCLHKQSSGQLAWQNVGKGLGSLSDGTVYALLNDTIHHLLYAGGSFTTLAGDSAGCDGLAIWDGSKWSTTVPYIGILTPNASSFTLYNGMVYVSSASGTVLHYNGSKWVLDGEFNGSVYTLAVYHDKLYAGGDFSRVNGKLTEQIACFDGTNWLPVGGGVYWSVSDAFVKALGVWRGKLYVGGAFDYVYQNDTDYISANSIAAWNDTSWSALGSGLICKSTGANTAYIYSICTYNDNLYAGGDEDTAGGKPAAKIARWDGMNWYPLLGGTNGTVMGMITKDSSLYVGGGFSSADSSTNSSSVARWDGNNWYSVGNGLTHSGEFLCFAIYNDELYGGGAFGGNYSGYTLNGIARYGLVSGIDNIKEENKSIIIYPNPATSQLTVNSNQLANGELEIKNLIGQTLLTQTITNPTTTLNIHNLAPGIYIVQLKSKQGISMGKFVKE